MLSSISQGEADLVNIHDIWIASRACSPLPLVALGNKVVPSLAQASEADHIPVEFSCLIEPLFPFPSSFLLTYRDSGSCHHSGQLLGYSSLKSVNKDIVSCDSTSGLSELECHSILVKVSMEVSCHGEGVDGLASPIFEVFRNKGLSKGFTELPECLFISDHPIVVQLDVPSFSKGGTVSFAHLVECYQHMVDIIILGHIHCKVCPHSRIHCMASLFLLEKSLGNLAFSSPLSGMFSSSSLLGGEGGGGQLGLGLHMS